jgi:hypothetical protein
MNLLWNTRRMMVGGAMALVVAAGAVAQSAPAAPTPPDAPKNDTTEGFDKPLKGARAKAGQKSAMQFTYMANDGDRNVRVKVNGDDVRAEVDGKPVPAERIKREGDQIRIFDENNNQIGAPITVGHVGTTVRGREMGMLRGLADVQGQFGMTSDEPPPPVMLGVTMSDADANVLKHLGVEGGAIQIDTVRDDLPAAKAGLKSDDLIVSINGQTPATREKLREILRGSKAGDELKLQVMRRGQSQDIVVKLEAYDAEKLGNVTLLPGVRLLEQEPGVQSWRFNTDELSEEMSERLKEAREAIASAMANIKESAKFESEKIREEVAKALEQAMESLAQEQESLAKAHEKLARRFNFLTVPSAPGQPRALAPESGMVFTVPGTPDVDRRMKALEEQNQALMKKLDELSKKLDEKK